MAKMPEYYIMKYHLVWHKHRTVYAIKNEINKCKWLTNSVLGYM